MRNYGFLVNNIGSIGTMAAPVSDPFAAGVVQVAPLDPSLAPLTDVYFRGYDQNYPDLWRYNEWKREFDQFVANGNLPSLSLVRVSHDHMGNFGTALGGVNTPETQQADDDLAVGRLVEAVAQSRYAADTLIIVTEDDCQDGPDHVDSHRATAYVVGPVREAGRGGQHALQPGQRAAHHRGHPRHAAHQPEHRLPAADDRRVRHPLVGRVELHRRGLDRAVERRRWRRRPAASACQFAQGPHRQAEARRRVLGQGHRRASTSPTPTRCRRPGSTGCCGRA